MVDDDADLATQFGELARATDCFPETELATERLVLRAYTEADVDAHLALFDHEAARRWSSGPVPYTRAHALAWCTRQANRARTTGDGINWAVTDRVTGELLGLAGLNHTDWATRVTDVNALGSRAAIGRGLAIEALRTISRWVLLEQGFNRVQITAATGNLPSQKVAEACGFVREGLLRNAGHTPSGQVDLIMYGLVPADLDQDAAASRSAITLPTSA
jgi:RimJ/RimL family protein N-acetyltransferase